jgi:hypothetical protein
MKIYKSDLRKAFKKVLMKENVLEQKYESAMAVMKKIITNKAKGNKFRAWARKNKSEQFPVVFKGLKTREGKPDLSLSRSGSYTNTHMKRAFAAFYEEYMESTGIKAPPKDLKANISYIAQYKTKKENEIEGLSTGVPYEKFIKGPVVFALTQDGKIYAREKGKGASYKLVESRFLNESIKSKYNFTLRSIVNDMTNVAKDQAGREEGDKRAKLDTSFLEKAEEMAASIEKLKGAPIKKGEWVNHINTKPKGLSKDALEKTLGNLSPDDIDGKSFLKYNIDFWANNPGKHADGFAFDVVGDYKNVINKLIKLANNKTLGSGLSIWDETKKGEGEEWKVSSPRGNDQGAHYHLNTNKFKLLPAGLALIKKMGISNPGSVIKGDYSGLKNSSINLMKLWAALCKRDKLSPPRITSGIRNEYSQTRIMLQQAAKRWKKGDKTWLKQYGDANKTGTGERLGVEWLKALNNAKVKKESVEIEKNNFLTEVELRKVVRSVMLKEFSLKKKIEKIIPKTSSMINKLSNIKNDLKDKTFKKLFDAVIKEKDVASSNLFRTWVNENKDKLEIEKALKDGGITKDFSLDKKTSKPENAKNKHVEAAFIAFGIEYITKIAGKSSKKSIETIKKNEKEKDEKKRKEVDMSFVSIGGGIFNPSKSGKDSVIAEPYVKGIIGKKGETQLAIAIGSKTGDMFSRIAGSGKLFKKLEINESLIYERIKLANDISVKDLWKAISSDEKNIKIVKNNVSNTARKKFEKEIKNIKEEDENAYHFLYDNNKKKFVKIKGPHPNATFSMDDKGYNALLRHEAVREFVYDDKRGTQAVRSHGPFKGYGKDRGGPALTSYDKVIPAGKGNNPNRPGYPTIGLGHLIYKKGEIDERDKFAKYLGDPSKGEKSGNVLNLMTDNEIKDLAMKDIAKHVKRITDRIKKYCPGLTMGQYQINAMGSYAFNVHPRHLELIFSKYLNEKNKVQSMDKAIAYMSKSPNNNGELTKRRKEEGEKFKKDLYQAKNIG